MTKNPPFLISIIVPYYNTKFNFFIEAIESVLAQSYTNWEIIIVDDGSTIENKKLLEKFSIEINNDRIAVLSLDKNYGASTAYSEGIKAAKGEIVTWLDADDVFLPWYLQEIISIFSTNSQCHILSTQCYFYLKSYNAKKIWTNGYLFTLFENSNMNGGNRARKILDNFKKVKNGIFPHLFFKKSVFKKISLDVNLTAKEDTDLQLQILNNEELLNSLIISPIIGYLYRTHASSSRVSCKIKSIHKAQEEMINKYNDKHSLAFKIINHWQNNSNSWKFCKFINNYLEGGSIINYIKSVFLNFKSAKDRIEGIKFLTRIVLKVNLMKIPGFNFASINTICSKQSNQYYKIKQEFQNYLNHSNNNQLDIYANNIFYKVFIK